MYAIQVLLQSYPSWKIVFPSLAVPEARVFQPFDLPHVWGQGTTISIRGSLSWSPFIFCLLVVMRDTYDPTMRHLFFDNVTAKDERSEKRCGIPLWSGGFEAEKWE